MGRDRPELLPGLAVLQQGVAAASPLALAVAGRDRQLEGAGRVVGGLAGLLRAGAEQLVPLVVVEDPAALGPALDAGLHQQGRPVHLVVVGLATLLGQLGQQARGLPTDLGGRPALAVGATGRDLLQQHHAGPRGQDLVGHVVLPQQPVALVLGGLDGPDVEGGDPQVRPLLGPVGAQCLRDHGLQVRVRLRDRLGPLLVHREQAVVEVVGRTQRRAGAGGLGGGQGVGPRIRPR